MSSQFCSLFSTLSYLFSFVEFHFSLLHPTIYNSTSSSIPVHSISSDSSYPFFSGCGYCKSMKPNYFKAAEILSEENVSGSSTLFDCGSSRTFQSFVFLSIPFWEGPIFMHSSWFVIVQGINTLLHHRVNEKFVLLL